MNYTNEELEKIYIDACNHSISNNELESIKEALYILTPISEFNPDGYSRLIQILKGIHEDKLDKIEDFKEMYDSGYKDVTNVSLGYTVCNYALNALFTDYSSTNARKEFKTLSDNMGYVIPCITKESYIETIGKINPDLKEVLINSFEFFRKKPSIQESFGYASAINTMYEEAVVTFLINKELYKNDYTLPSKVMISLLDNRYDSLELMSMYFKCRDVEVFMKSLFNIYIKQNGILFERDKTKNKNRNNTLVS